MRTILKFGIIGGLVMFLFNYMLTFLFPNLNNNIIFATYGLVNGIILFFVDFFGLKAYLNNIKYKKYSYHIGLLLCLAMGFISTLTLNFIFHPILKPEINFVTLLPSILGNALLSSPIILGISILIPLFVDEKKNKYLNLDNDVLDSDLSNDDSL